MAKPGPKPKRKAIPKWTTKLAYACGLLATDGCLINDGRHIDLTSKDIEQLETFKKCLGLTCKIGSKRPGIGQNPVPRIQFSDVILYRWLISIGITPRKTHTIGRIDIPDKYFFDYLRGEFDGDGHSHAYWDTRWHSSVSLCIGFACSSKDHLFWINKTINRLIGISGCVQPLENLHRLLFSKKKALILYKSMYYQNNIPCLSRKKEKLDRQLAANKLAAQGKQPTGFVRDGPVLRIA